MARCLFLVACLCLSSCAALHRVQLSDIEANTKGKAKPISVKVSETTLDFREMASLAKLGGRAFNSRGASNVGKGLEAYTFFFQFGPRTGTPVYSELYARYIPELLREKCPKGHLSDIVSIRETREYPVVKGEIVRIEANCIE